MMQTMDFGLEVKALDDVGTIEGYASVFGNVDSYGERVAPGAFADGLVKAQKQGRSVKMLWNHDTMQPIGVWDELAENAKGLSGKGRLVMEVPKAREVYALAKAGAIGGLSIGFRTLADEQDGNVRVLTSLDLFEVSLVTFPANAKAKLTAVKADGHEEIIEKLKAGDRLTEREFEHLAKGLGLSNSQAERAARVHLKGQGEPAKAVQSGDAFLRALLGQMA